MVILLLLLGCEQPPPAPPPDTSAPGEPALDIVQQLARISLDVRGVRPNDDEIDQVLADPGALTTLTDTFLQDERWAGQVRDLYGILYRTRYESYYIVATEYGFTDLPSQAEFDRSLSEEPLYLLSTVAEEDLPWSTIVTGDWTVLNETMAGIWPTDYPAGGTGWQKVHYTDDRPAVGVLATNTMWIRYYSTDSNANRGRANQISRLLLCSDYLERPVEFDLSASAATGDELLDALRTNPSCVTCHAALDPLASYLYGFWNYGYPSAEDNRTYHPEREPLWVSVTGVAPSYFGSPSYTLSELGENIAADPRFTACATEQIFESLLGRDTALGDTDALEEHRQSFISSGQTLRSLYRSITADPRYLADGTLPDLQMDRKLADGALLGKQTQALTGFAWEHAGNSMWRTDLKGGLRILAGGTDGGSVNTRATLPNVTYVLSQERLAELAADYAVATESELDPAERTLFTEIDFTETPSVGQDAVVAQIIARRRRVLSQMVTEDSDAVAEDYALWEALYNDTGSAAQSWQGLLVVLLRDPDFGTY